MQRTCLNSLIFLFFVVSDASSGDAYEFQHTEGVF